MKKFWLEFSVGLFVLTGVVGIFFLATKVATSDSFGASSSYRVFALFDNIGGLKPRSPVKSAGVLVGRVKSVSLDPKTYQAKVEMDMDTRYRFPSDSALKISTAGLLGEQYVALEAGNNDENLLKDGGQIKRTQSALILENVIGQILYNKASETPDNTKK
jgi:phospholipid/cholesterol/gamma-HCH transport system substrate-binding protein